jgi:MFS family permease
VAAPASYGICFLAAAVFMGLSWLALAAVREPAAATVSASVPLRRFLARVVALVRDDRNLASYLLARVFAAIGGMASGFYTVYALATFTPPTWQVGVFTAALLTGQLAGHAVLGSLADRAGHRLVMLIGTIALMVANVVALTAPSVGLFTVVFVLAGACQGAFAVSGLTILLEFAPTPEEQPTYVGLGNTALGPVLLLAPLAAGALADRVGFASVFAVAAMASTLATSLLLARVQDPRHARRPAVAARASDYT